MSSPKAIATPDEGGFQLVVLPTTDSVIEWNATSKPLLEGVPSGPGTILRLREETARAIYWALDEHFGW